MINLFGKKKKPTVIHWVIADIEIWCSECNKEFQENHTYGRKTGRNHCRKCGGVISPSKVVDTAFKCKYARKKTRKNTTNIRSCTSPTTFASYSSTLSPSQLRSYNSRNGTPRLGSLVPAGARKMSVILY